MTSRIFMDAVCLVLFADLAIPVLSVLSSGQTHGPPLQRMAASCSLKCNVFSISERSSDGVSLIECGSTRETATEYVAHTLVPNEKVLCLSKIEWERPDLSISWI